ncbi:MAG: hypothetical protein GYB36_01940 [Alphaproteobacteria bacterium]|nr:hypothetical protein [Alphaproteobacteria bacterium]
MIGLPRFLVRVCFSVLLLGMSGWAALSAIDHGDVERIGQSSDAAFRTRMAGQLPGSASAEWYNAVAERAMRLNPPDADLASRAYQRSLQNAPRNAVAWGYYAYALQLMGHDTQTVLRALTQSYAVSAIAELPFRQWRLRYAETLWTTLPDTLRARVLQEAQLEDLAWLRTACPQIYAALAEANN